MQDGMGMVDVGRFELNQRAAFVIGMLLSDEESSLWSTALAFAPRFGGGSLVVSGFQGLLMRQGPEFNSFLIN